MENIKRNVGYLGTTKKENTNLVLTIPFTNGYIIHDGNNVHIDEVNLHSIIFNQNELIFRFEGICEEDGMPFDIDIKEDEFYNRIFNTRHAAIANMTI